MVFPSLRIIKLKLTCEQLPTNGEWIELSRITKFNIFQCCFYIEWKRRRDTSRRHGSDRRLGQHHVQQPRLQQNHSDDPDSGVERHHDGRRWTSAAASGKSSSDNVRTPCNYFCRVLSASWFSCVLFSNCQVSEWLRPLSKRLTIIPFIYFPL